MSAVFDKGLETYRLSSQQSGAHVPDWSKRVPVTAVIAEGPADDAALASLKQALYRLVGQHESLRTVFGAVPGLAYPVQAVLDTGSFRWVTLDHADDAALLSAARAGIDPQTGPVVAVAASAVQGGRVRLALAAASFNLDASSIQDLLRACLARTVDDGEVLQYPDYVAWQQEVAASDVGQEGARFWNAQAVQAQRLPFEIGTAGAGPCIAVTRPLSDQAMQQASAAARLAGVPVSTVLAAIWAGHFARLTGSPEVAFEWRCGTRPDELAGALGCFDSHLPVSIVVDGDQPLNDLVRLTADRLREAESWHECFDAAAWQAALTLAGRGRPGVVFAHVPLIALPGDWSVRQLVVDSGAAHLRCDCIEAPGRMLLRWSSDGRYDARTLEVWMRQFEVLLEGLAQHAAQPWRQHPLATRDEQIALIDAAATLGQAPAAATLHALFEDQARQHPDAVAVVCGDVQLSYGELARLAERVAARLRRQGVRPEQVVGVHLGRSVHAIVAMIGVMKSGAAYVPLDPAYPAERIALMIDDARMAAVIVARGAVLQGAPLLAIEDVLEAPTDEAAPASPAAGGHLAYLIYTSGSTGRPKGVMVSHANAVASTCARFEFYPERVERFLLLSSFSFDSSVAGIFWTLGQGGTLCLPTEDAHRDPARIALTVSQQRISHLLALPSFYQQIIDQLDDASSLRCAIVAGEACHPEVVERHQQRAPGAALVNEYGPTEGTVWSNASRITAVPARGQRVPIGRAIPSMRSVVLDEQLEPCAVGQPGELYIGGDGITRGYRERPGLTAQRFVADPFTPGQRLYRTSDLARLRPDGEIDYLGRADHQVKLRGHRIELGEIEALLRADARVHDTVALVQDDPALGQRLLAFVAGEADAVELRAQLGQRLPAYMVPAQIVVLPKLPSMPNGKVDRQALLAVGAAGQRPPFVAPASEVECTLAGIWADVLQQDCIGLDDDFFELGGHSLLATQVTSRIRQQLSVDLPLRELFEVTTLRELSAKVDALSQTSDAELAFMDDLLADAESATADAERVQ